jgi:hypothetical protein
MHLYFHLHGREAEARGSLEPRISRLRPQRETLLKN